VDELDVREENMPIIRQESEDDDTPWPDDDFTGEWIVEWPNGHTKVKSRFIDGKQDGEYLCCWANGNFAQKGTNRNGVCIGLWEDFWEDGTKFKETCYEDPGNFTERWLGEQGKVERIRTFRNHIEQNPEQAVPPNGP
jgi:antitoxin component YwqK of YwqJK toxin-antitoxin module